jgi:hypothetical protein
VLLAPPPPLIAGSWDESTCSLIPLTKSAHYRQASNSAGTGLNQYFFVKFRQRWTYKYAKRRHSDDLEKHSVLQSWSDHLKKVAIARDCLRTAPSTAPPSVKEAISSTGRPAIEPCSFRSGTTTCSVLCVKSSRAGPAEIIEPH